jgi:hypothetical protein
MYQISAIGTFRMLVTDKVFFASTLFRTVACSSATFRAWRNRNGLFPETQGAGGWNRFSIGDVLVAALVSELTRGGIAAQTAVEAAMMASQPLTDLCGIEKNDKDHDLGKVVLRILKKWARMKDFPVLTIGRAGGGSLSVEFTMPVDMPILRVFSASDAEKSIPMVVTIVYLARLLPDLLMELLSVESEYDRAKYPPELLSPTFVRRSD